MQANSSAYSNDEETVAGSSRMICKKVDNASDVSGSRTLQELVVKWAVLI